MNEIVVGGISGLLSGAMYGAIGAGASQQSDSPILKGAIVSGLIGGTLSTIVFAARSAGRAEGQQLPGNTGGVFFP